MGESSLGSLARREALLLSFLGFAATIGALGKFAGSPVLEFVAIVIAIAGAATRIVIALRRGRVESEIEEVARGRRTRVPVCPIGDVDPTQVGVDAAPPQGILTGGSIPSYVPREIDEELRAAIDAAVSGRGAWIVVAVGPSKVGKSRALFEALSRSSGQAPMGFVAPVDAEAALALSAPGELAEIEAGGSVLWLDDLEPFINQGLSLKDLREWRERHPGSVVAATYGGKGSEVVREAGASGLATVADEILQQSQEVLVGGTSPHELEPLKGKVSDDVLRSIEQHGLAAYLVAGPKLQRKLGTGIHSPGEPACPEGVAVVYATVDWARCGRTDPIPEATLRQLWADYLPRGVRSTDEAFEAGLEWALKPVAGTIALIEHANSYLAYDYVVRIVEGGPGVEPPTESAWRAAITGAGAAQAVGVGITAYQREAYGHAAEAFVLGRESPDPIIRAIAGVNLGVSLREQGEYEAALAAFEYMVQFEDSDSAVLSEGAVFSLVAMGTMLVFLERREEALVVFGEVTRRYADADEPAARTQGARALFHQTLVLGELERLDEAFAAYDDLLARFGADQDPGVREVVADGLFNKGVALIKMERYAAAVEACDDLLARVRGEDAAHLRELAAKALANKANCHGRLGQGPEAIASLDESVSAFRGEAEAVIRSKALDAQMLKAAYLAEQERHEEALTAYRQVIDWFGADPDPQIRASASASLLAIGRRLIQAERLEEALAVFEEAVERLERDEGVFEELLAEAYRDVAEVLGFAKRHQEELAAYDRLIARFAETEEPQSIAVAVAIAMYNKGTQLWTMDEREAAIEAFDRLVARFGDAAGSTQREVVARALVNKGGILLNESSYEGALLTLEEAVARFHEDSDLAVREEVARAMLGMAVAHAGLDEVERAAAALDKLLIWIDDAQEEGLREAAEQAAKLLDDLAG